MNTYLRNFRHNPAADLDTRPESSQVADRIVAIRRADRLARTDISETRVSECGSLNYREIR